MSPWHLAASTVAGLAFAAGAWASGVTGVYPSGSSVPENLLRIELRLSTPLRRPLDMAHVKLLDGEGQLIPDALLDLPLPSADGRRVALLLHPGRVKSGVGANLALGRALRAGTSVTLVIDNPAIGPVVRKPWQVMAFDDDRPLPSSWRLRAPAAWTRQPLVVRLHAPISASSEGLIAVKRQGQRVLGRGRLADGETTWQFTPTTPWQAGAHLLVTHPDLESPQGHRACARFEQISASNSPCEEGVEIGFDIQRR